MHLNRNVSGEWLLQKVRGDGAEIVQHRLQSEMTPERAGACCGDVSFVK